MTQRNNFSKSLPCYESTKRLFTVVVLTCRCFHFSGLIKPLLMTAWVWANSAPGTRDSPVHPPGWSCWWQTWLFFLLTASVNETFDAGCEISCFFFFFKSNEFLLELREQKLCCTETTVNCLWSTNQNLSVYLIQKPPHHHPFYPPAVCKYNEEQSSETVFQFLYSSQVNHLDHLFAESLAKLIISYLTWLVTQTQTEPGLTDQLKAFRSLFPFFVGKRIQQCRALMA